MKKHALLLLFVAILFGLAGCKSSDYKDAIALYEAKQYEDARSLFHTLGDYKDSLDYAEKCNMGLDYQKAERCLETGDYKNAAYLLARLGDFENSKDLRHRAKFGLLSEYLQSLNDGNSYSKIVTFDDGYLVLAITGDSPEQISLLLAGNYLYWLVINVDGTAVVNTTFGDDYTNIPFNIAACTSETPVIKNEISSADIATNVYMSVILSELPNLLDELPVEIKVEDLGFYNLK